LADRYEQCRYELNRCSHDVSCATKLICLLLKISVNLSNENSQLLNAILSPVRSDDNEQVIETLKIIYLTPMSNFPREIFFRRKRITKIH
jgi:hypothetical protein